MPQDPVIWIVLIVAVSLVIVFAVWKRRGVKGGVGGATFEITSEQQNTDIKVAEGAKLEQVKAGDVAGIKGAEIDNDGNVEVAKGLQATHAELGDIVGIKKSDQP
jgi:hypothetical protein